MLRLYLWVAVGSALGGALRYWTAAFVGTLTGPAFPWGTLLINVLGSFVIGLFGTLTGEAGRFGAGPEIRAFVMVGICGGYTTFSSFSLQTLELIQQGEPGRAAGYVILSVALCLVGVWCGYLAAAALNMAEAGP